MLFGAVNAQAESDYDTDTYDSQSMTNDNLFSIIPPTPINIGTPPSTKKTLKTDEKTDNKQVSTPKDNISAVTKETTVKAPPLSVPSEATKETEVEPVKKTENTDIPPLSLFETSETDQSKASPTQESWIGKSYDKLMKTVSAPSDEEQDVVADESIEDMIESSRNNKKRANASVFDISGVMLRMTLPQVENALKSRKFSKVSVKFEIPNFIKWRNEEKCRNNGVVGYERLNSCVVTLSKKDGHQYPETVKFMRFDTQEEITVKLTSNFSSNKVYWIYYSSLAPAVSGNSAKANYLRNIKVYDFWKKINRKYGSPDNKDEIIWGLGGNKPYLKASSGKLLLEDPMLRELDYTRMSREDQRFMNTDLFNF